MTKTLQERFEERFGFGLEELVIGDGVDVSDKVLAWAEQELELQRKGIVEEVKEDFIRRIFRNSYGKEKYPVRDNETPFDEWVEEANVRDMREWK